MIIKSANPSGIYGRASNTSAFMVLLMIGVPACSIERDTNLSFNAANSDSATVNVLFL